MIYCGLLINDYPSLSQTNWTNLFVTFCGIHSILHQNSNQSLESSISQWTKHFIFAFTKSPQKSKTFACLSCQSILCTQTPKKSKKTFCFDEHLFHLILIRSLLYWACRILLFQIFCCCCHCCCHWCLYCFNIEKKTKA